MAYAKDDYWFREATLYRGDEKLFDAKFYSEYQEFDGREMTVEIWAQDKMMLDMIKRGEVKSYEINLSREDANAD